MVPRFLVIWKEISSIYNKSVFYMLQFYIDYNIVV